MKKTKLNMKPSEDDKRKCLSKTLENYFDQEKGLNGLTTVAKLLSLINQNLECDRALSVPDTTIIDNILSPSTAFHIHHFIQSWSLELNSD